jgi:hypothetical protein
MAAAPGACSFSYQLDSLFAKDDQAASAASLRSAMPKRIDEPLAERDLAIASEAVSEVLAKGGKDSSMPWENPSTGARGTITPACFSVHPGRDNLPQLPCELCEEWKRVLVAGRRLPRLSGEVGGAPSAALEQYLTDLPREAVSKHVLVERPREPVRA